MLEVFLCCSPVDRDVAVAIAARLERVEAAVVRDDSAQESVAVRWEGGLSSAAILLLLSPDAVPALHRENWEAVLRHLRSGAGPPLGSVLVRDCEYPRLLERKDFFRWTDGPRETLRSIERRVMRLHEVPEKRFVPARLPWFEGCRRELDLLWDALVDNSGAAVVIGKTASGKTSLVQEFAREAGSHFRDVLWIACRGRSGAAIAGDLAEQLGVELEGTPEELLGRVIERAGRHRVLVVLDDVPESLELPADQQGRASVLMTARSRVGVERRARRIRLEQLPEVAVEQPGSGADWRLWLAMAVCRKDGFPLELAAKIAELSLADAEAACERLIDGRLADRLESTRLRLSAFSLAAAEASEDLEPLRRRHAEAVCAAVSQWAECPEPCKRYLAELAPALEWATAGDWRLAVRLARQAFAYLRSRGRVAEGAELLVALRDAADQREDWRVSDECSWELSWIRNLPHRGADRAPEAGDQLSFDFA